ncbi:MAG: DUF3048 domain-containing protein [Candidatus Moranbacteria bacterium]|nr:DUF3048 domain-containing protein [Candidatus Moranbacteria bacterium]
MNIDPNDYEKQFADQPNVGQEPEGGKEVSWKKWVAFLSVIIFVAAVAWWAIGSKNSRKGELIEIDPGSVRQAPINEGEVSPISGLACENWNRRPIAVMQPADVPARPAAGIFDADMVIEMPVLTTGFTRLMSIYICGNPEEVGSMRSARPDFVHLAKGFDAIFVHWGRAALDSFIGNLNDKVIDNLNCNGDAGQSAVGYCFRKEGMSRGVDSGYAKFDELLRGIQDFGYRTESHFEGYPHQVELPEEKRIEKGNLEIGYPGDLEVSYDYDRTTNSYIRYWGGERQTDRNNGNLITPKNVVVLLAKDNNMEEDPHYNNVELGDPWYDSVDSGEAYYFMNGEEIRGRWSKDKSKMDSKLILTDANGMDIKFVPGQIWLSVAYPNMKVDWDPGISYADELIK